MNTQIRPNGVCVSCLRQSSEAKVHEGRGEKGEAEDIGGEYEENETVKVRVERSRGWRPS